MSSTRKLFLVIGIPSVIAFFAVFLIAARLNKNNVTTETPSGNQITEVTKNTACDTLVTPVDPSQVTAILYPGQTRGGQYKAHGGFRLDKATTNQVEVKAPLDAEVVDGSRYIEQGEIQYLFDFKTSCGLQYRFDHLRTVSAKLQTLAEKLPAAVANNSQTTNFSNKVTVSAGEVIATAVGFEKGSTGLNVSFDFGLYDMKHKNAASKNAAWLTEHKDNAFASYGVCWLDYLTTSDSITFKALPGGDQTAGKTSDYCTN